MWVEMAAPIVEQFQKSMNEIYDDPVNDKNSRFMVKVEDYAQQLTR